MPSIYSVDQVTVKIVRTDPPTLILLAEGRVASTGWTDPRLDMRFFALPPRDGVLEYDFIARRPPAEQTILPMLTPVHADTTVSPLDLDNHWGPGAPLRGIRVHAQETTRCVLFDTDPRFGPPLDYLAPDEVTQLHPGAKDEPSFEADIRPLFRRRDRLCMKAYGRFDLHDLDDVRANAERIFERLDDGTMPDDGGWPQADVDLFRRWIDAGMID